MLFKYIGKTVYCIFFLGRAGNPHSFTLDPDPKALLKVTTVFDIYESVIICILSFRSFVGDEYVVMFFGINKRVNDLFIFCEKCH